LSGLPIAFALIGAKADERETLPDLERHHGRSHARAIARVLQRILALTATIWRNENTGEPTDCLLAAYDH
jgi:hypothetical protein